MILRMMIVIAVALLVLTSLNAHAQAPEDGAIIDSEVRVVSFTPFEYPAIAHTARAEGVVVVRARLDKGGKVVDVAPLSGNGLLIQSVLRSAKTWEFEPNSYKAAILVFYFRIEGVCHDNTDPSQFIFHPPNFATVTACGKTWEETRSGAK
jgi:TonB family protein